MQRTCLFVVLMLPKANSSSCFLSFLFFPRHKMSQLAYTVAVSCLKDSKQVVLDPYTRFLSFYFSPRHTNDTTCLHNNSKLPKRYSSSCSLLSIYKLLFSELYLFIFFVCTTKIDTTFCLHSYLKYTHQHE